MHLRQIELHEPNPGELGYVLTFHSDPGHGWLEVNRGVCDKIGVTDKLSGYSYVGRDIVLAEEDCDAMIVINALKAHNCNYVVYEMIHGTQDNKIRKLVKGAI